MFYSQEKKVTSLLLSGENSITLIDETQFLDNIMFHICQAETIKWYSSGLCVSVCVAMNKVRHWWKSKGEVQQHKEDRSNIIAATCVEFLGSARCEGRWDTVQDTVDTFTTTQDTLYCRPTPCQQRDIDVDLVNLQLSKQLPI